MQYDYVIVGAGLFGSIFAYEAGKRGKRCLVLEKRDHIGGNCYTEDVDGIQMHRYGAHIFHTDDKKIWDYIGQFTEFNRFTNTPLAHYQGKLYSLPFNMMTFNQMWGVTTPQQAEEEIRRQIEAENISEPQNLEQQALSLVGRDIYEILIKGYTEKQWGRPCHELPAFIIRRLPVRYTYNNNYFNDAYQGIPTKGYTAIFEALLENAEVRLNSDYFSQRELYDCLAPKMLFTGMIDHFFDYRFGKLNYRSLHFEHEMLPIANYQGNAVVNYTEAEVPYTRIIEHKHFTFGTQPNTLISKEFPKDYGEGDEPFYPINDAKNSALYAQYQALASQLPQVIFGGRLAQYRYFDMHQVIAEALNCVKNEFGE